ncbi:multidrug efflux system outer membrane protein [Oxalobacteraceae bacterium GrIS 2.11]
MKRRSHFVLGVLALACLSACQSGPDYHKIDTATPLNWQTQTQFQPAQPSDAQLKDNWWEMFGDTQLTQLEQQALAHNQCLVAAAEHLNQARLQVTVSSAGQLPAVDLVTGAARSKTSANRPLSSYNVANSSVVQNNLQVGLAVNYEADLFGRVRRVVESSKAAAEQAGADFENTRLILMADLASNYFNLRELDGEIAIVQKGVDLQGKALDFIRRRYELDYASGLELAQQQALLEANQTQLALLQNRRAGLQNAIATLTGTAAPEFKLAAQTELVAMPAMPTALPSEVLQRRPDVAAAERAMAVANANIGVARAAYYPSIILQAGGGWDSNKWSNLISAPSLLWALGATATEHLFDAGKTTANVKIAESSYVQTVANYRQSVLVAMQEVQTGIDSLTILNAASAKAEAAARSSEKVLDIANARYAGGLDIYLNVITAQQTLLANQRQALQIRGQQLANAVFLVKAMGGGWQGLEVTGAN